MSGFPLAPPGVDACTLILSRLLGHPLPSGKSTPSTLSQHVLCVLQACTVADRVGVGVHFNTLVPLGDQVSAQQQRARHSLLCASCRSDHVRSRDALMM